MWLWLPGPGSADGFSESDVAASSSASPSASSDSVIDSGTTAMSASMASSNVLPSIMSLEIVIFFHFLGVLGFLDLAELPFMSFSDLDEPDSQAVMAPRPKGLVNEGMVDLNSVFRIVGVRWICASQEGFKGKYACQGLYCIVLCKCGVFLAEKMCRLLPCSYTHCRSQHCDV